MVVPASCPKLAAEITAVRGSLGCRLEQAWCFPKIGLRVVAVYQKVY